MPVVAVVVRTSPEPVDLAELVAEVTVVPVAPVPWRLSPEVFSAPVAVAPVLAQFERALTVRPE
jgi:hypothetical protein